MTKVALVCGICVEHDAISAAVVAQAHSLLTMDEIESVHVFTQHFDRDVDFPVHPVTSSWALLRHPEFASADVAIFHWGIHYDLFDATIAAGAASRNGDGPVPVVHFHNCTPRELVEEDSRFTIDRSIQQLQLVPHLDLACWTFSPFNTTTLQALGVPPERITFVPFPIEAPRALKAVRRSEGVDIVVVGRIVRAKGHHVLFDALTLLPAEIRDKVRVRIAGNTTFSSLDYLRELKDRIERAGLASTVEFIGQPDTDSLWSLYEQSHLLVSASLHEGLCVPVIEAYIADCRVVGAAAGNLPYVVREPDRLVAPDDPVALAGAIAATAREIMDGVAVDRRSAQLLVADFTEGSVVEHLRAALRSLPARSNHLEGALT